MHFVPLHIEETYVSLWHMIEFESLYTRALKLKRFSKSASQSYRSKPRVEANQLIVSFSNKLLTEGN